MEREDFKDVKFTLKIRVKLFFWTAFFLGLGFSLVFILYALTKDPILFIKGIYFLPGVVWQFSFIYARFFDVLLIPIIWPSLILLVFTNLGWWKRVSADEYDLGLSVINFIAGAMLCTLIIIRPANYIVDMYVGLRWIMIYLVTIGLANAFIARANFKRCLFVATVVSFGFGIAASMRLSLIPGLLSAFMGLCVVYFACLLGVILKYFLLKFFPQLKKD